MNDYMLWSVVAAALVLAVLIGMKLFRKPQPMPYRAPSVTDEQLEEIERRKPGKLK